MDKALSVFALLFVGSSVELWLSQRALNWAHAEVLRDMERAKGRMANAIAVADREGILESGQAFLGSQRTQIVTRWRFISEVGFAGMLCSGVAFLSRLLYLGVQQQ